MTDIRRPVLRYFGGKWRLAPHIIKYFPPHKVYVEPFGGAGSVLMRKPRSRSEVYNDLDGEIVNVFRVLRDPELANKLKMHLCLTPYSREEFDLAHVTNFDPVESARRSIVRSFFGHGAASLTREYKSGFRAKSFGSNHDPSKDWVNYPPAIVAFCERLQGVIIENKSAIEVMSTNDTPDTLHYVDPPYLFETRSDQTHGYRHEMTEHQHLELCEFLKQLKGMVVISTYPNEIYSTALPWQSVTMKALADGARERVECLYINDAAAKAQSQFSFDLGGFDG